MSSHGNPVPDGFVENSDGAAATVADDGIVIKDEPNDDDDTLEEYIIPKILGVKIEHGTLHGNIKLAAAIIRGHFYLGGILKTTEISEITTRLTAHDDSIIIEKHSRCSIKKFVEHLESIPEMYRKLDKEAAEKKALLVKARALGIIVGKLENGKIYAVVTLNDTAHVGGPDLTEDEGRVVAKNPTNLPFAQKNIRFHPKTLSEFVSYIDELVTAAKEDAKLKTKAQSLNITLGDINGKAYAAVLLDGVVRIGGDQLTRPQIQIVRQKACIDALKKPFRLQSKDIPEFVDEIAECVALLQPLAKKIVVAELHYFRHKLPGGKKYEAVNINGTLHIGGLLDEVEFDKAIQLCRDNSEKNGLPTIFRSQRYPKSIDAFAIEVRKIVNQINGIEDRMLAAKITKAKCSTGKSYAARVIGSTIHFSGQNLNGTETGEIIFTMRRSVGAGNPIPPGSKDHALPALKFVAEIERLVAEDAAERRRKNREAYAPIRQAIANGKRKRPAPEEDEDGEDGDEGRAFSHRKNGFGAEEPGNGDDRGGSQRKKQRRD